VPLLVEHFAQRAARRHALPAPKIPAAVMRHLIEYSWPGNARELANVVERLLLLAEGGGIAESDLPAEVRGAVSERAADGAFRVPAGGLRWEEHERSVLQQALALAHGNRARAARLLDLPYKAFLYRLEKHELGPAEPGNPNIPAEPGHPKTPAEPGQRTGPAGLPESDRDS
jgi:two-component system NtrC family response regulator